jgi:hypothetical protein
MKAGSWFLSLFWRKNSFHSSKRKSVLSYYYRKRVNGKTKYFGRIYPDTSWRFDNKFPDYFYLNLCLEINFIFFCFESQRKMKAGSWFLSLFWRKNSFHSSKRKSVLSYYFRKRVNGTTKYFGRIYPDTGWRFDNKCPDYFHRNLCLEINFIFFVPKVREKWKPGRGFLAFFGEKILFIQVKEKVCFLTIFANGWMAKLNILVEYILIPVDDLTISFQTIFI